MLKKNIAVITGASSGLGKEFVRLLYQKKDIQEIWAIARNREKLIALQETFGEKIRIFPLDLSDSNARNSLYATFEQEKPTIQYLINNAGFAKFCSYDDLTVEESINMIDLNISALVAVGLFSIPYMPAGSHILNIASIASFQPLPYQNIYSSTKAFVRHYSRALNKELKEQGVSVTAVCPGWMNTPLLERAKIGAKKATTKFAGITPTHKVASKALRDAEQCRDMSVYGWYAHGCHFLSKLLPQKWMMKIWLHSQKL